MDFKIGDRLRHQSGTIWRVQEIYPSSLQLSYGEHDRVAVKIEEIHSLFVAE